MNEEDVSRKKMAKEIDDFKQSRKAAKWYWVFLVLEPLMFIGFNTASYIVIGVLLVLSIHIKTRVVAYILLTVPIIIYAFYLGGWVGMLAGFVPAFLFGGACIENYEHHKKVKELEDE